MADRQKASNLGNTSRVKKEFSQVRLLLTGDEPQLHAAIQDLLAGRSLVTVTLEESLVGSQTALHKPSLHLRRLPVRQPGGVILYLPVGQIDWIEATDQYVRLHTVGKQYLVRESMSSLESMLDPTEFRRIHRSAIVNLDRVRELSLASPTHRWAVLSDGIRLPVSQIHWAGLQEALLGLS